MSQLSADPLRNAALNELLSVDALALRTVRRGEFESALSRAQQRREPAPPSESPNTRGAPPEAADSSDRDRRRSTDGESSAPPSPESAARVATTEDEQSIEDAESKDSEKVETEASSAADGTATAGVDGETASGIDGETETGEIKEASEFAAVAENNAGRESAVMPGPGEQSLAESDSKAGAASGKTGAAAPAATADQSDVAANQAQTPTEPKPQGPAQTVAAADALERDQRNKFAATEESNDSGGQSREQGGEQGSTQTGSAEAALDVEALHAPPPDALNRQRRGEAAPGNSGPRRANAAADARAGSRRSRTAEAPAAANLPAAQSATAEVSTEPKTTGVSTATANPAIAASALTTSQPASLPSSAAPEAAPAAIGVRSLPAKTSAAAAESATETPGREANVGIDRARFVQRVAGAFRSLNEHNHTLRLKLSPPELGSLRIEITVRNGQMSARLEAETPEARNLLLDHLPALRERLAGQEIKIQQFHVEVADRQPGGGTQFAGQDESRRRDARAAAVGGPARGKSAAADVETARESRSGGDGRLNVIV